MGKKNFIYLKFFGNAQASFERHFPFVISELAKKVSFSWQEISGALILSAIIKWKGV